MILRTLLLASFATVSLAQGVGNLETPAPNSSQSGIGVISGWHCTANKIEIKIDDFAPLVAGSGTARADTAGVCGHADTGFSLLFNWNILPTECFGCRFHRVLALADGVPFGSASFGVSKFGQEFMTGKSALYSLPNFPTVGNETVLRWDEDMQNFTVYIAGTFPNTVAPDGNYFGALITGPNNPSCGPYNSTNFPVRYGTFVIGNPSASPIAGPPRALSFTARYADGGTCQLGGASIEPFDTQNRDGFLTATFSQAATAACPEYPGGLRITVDGRRFTGTSLDNCATARLTGAR